MSYQIICDSATRRILGVYTDDPAPAEGQYKREVAAEEYGASLANRGDAVLIDGPDGITADPANTLADALLVKWDALPSGVRAMFDPLRIAVNAALRAGDYATARDIIATAPLPDSLEDTRTDFLSEIPES